MTKLNGKNSRKKKEELYQQYWKQVKQEQIEANNGKELTVVDMLKNICKNQKSAQQNEDKRRQEEEEAEKQKQELASKQKGHNILKDATFSKLVDKISLEYQ